MTKTFDPRFQISSRIKQDLQKIEIIRHKISSLAVPKSFLHMAERHQIQFFELLEDTSPNRQELKGFLVALEQVNRWSTSQEPISERMIKQLHALIMGKGKTTIRATPYRHGQNGVLDPETLEVLYLPPKAKDVSPLMQSLLQWINDHETLACPIVAAIAHFGINSIHPYYDGNGRCARLLTWLILQRRGYDLQGLLCLEEYYAKDLAAYYQALTIKNSNSYYDGPAILPITSWLEYFCKGMLYSCTRTLHLLRLDIKKKI